MGKSRTCSRIFHSWTLVLRRKYWSKKAFVCSIHSTLPCFYVVRRGISKIRESSVFEVAFQRGRIIRGLTGSRWQRADRIHSGPRRRSALSRLWGVMEQTAACVMNAGLESYSLRPCGGSSSSLSSSPGRFSQYRFFELAVSQPGAGPYSSTGALPRRFGSRDPQVAPLLWNAGSEDKKDLPVGNLYRGSVDSHWPAGRLRSRLGLDNHGRGLLDCPAAASVPRLGNAVALVDKVTRNSNSLVLTTEDLPRLSTSFERTELSLASQKSLVLPEQASDTPRQLCVAVDVDEVLGSFLASLNRFIEETYSVHHDISEYYIYDFMKIWHCSQGEANLRVHAFFESDHFKNGISPIPGAHQTLLQLASYCQLVVVTSRQHVIRDRTLEWIDRYYAGIFKEVHFGNHFALEGPSRRKSEICRSLGAHVLIDDNPRYAIDCAECGIEVLLFDLHGGYPWSKTPCGPQHPLITRVKDWQEVEQALLARTCAKL